MSQELYHLINKSLMQGNETYRIHSTLLSRIPTIPFSGIDDLSPELQEEACALNLSLQGLKKQKEAYWCAFDKMNELGINVDKEWIEARENMKRNLSALKKGAEVLSIKIDQVILKPCEDLRDINFQLKVFGFRTWVPFHNANFIIFALKPELEKKRNKLLKGH